MSANRTTVTLLLTWPDGSATFGVFRARVRNPDKRWTWNLHKATQVGKVHVSAGEQRPSYRAMAERYATPDYPALEYPEDRT